MFVLVTQTNIDNGFDMAILPHTTVTEYNIIRKIETWRYHTQPRFKCQKKYNGEKWVGECYTCDKYASLWHEGKAAQARILKPIERHTFETDGEPFICGKQVAEMIGKRTGKFNLVKRLICTGIGAVPCYDKSYFTEPERNIVIIE